MWVAQGVPLQRGGMAPHQIVEVSASSAPKDVIGAIVSGPSKSAPASSNRFIHLGFVFILVFGVIIYFREEIYTLTRDVQRHPILAAVENQQLHKYLGSNWVFGSGTAEDRNAEVILVDVVEANSTLGNTTL